MGKIRLKLTKSALAIEKKEEEQDDEVKFDDFSFNEKEKLFLKG